VHGENALVNVAFSFSKASSGVAWKIWKFGTHAVTLTHRVKQGSSEPRSEGP
jgi:hypothetical protein